VSQLYRVWRYFVLADQCTLRSTVSNVAQDIAAAVSLRLRGDARNGDFPYC